MDHSIEESFCSFLVLHRRMLAVGIIFSLLVFKQKKKGKPTNSHGCMLFGLQLPLFQEFQFLTENITISIGHKYY